MSHYQRSRYGAYTGNKYSLPRALQIVCLIATIVLVAKYDDGTCIKWSSSKSRGGTTMCDVRINSTIGIAQWSDKNGYQELIGQYFVFISAIVFCLVSVVLCFLTATRRQSQTVVIVQTPVYSLQPQGVPGQQGQGWWTNPQSMQQQIYGGRVYPPPMARPQGGAPPQSPMVKFVVCLGAFVMLVAGGLEGWYASGFGRVPNVIWLYAAASGTCFAASVLYLIDFIIGISIESNATRVA